jgi:hypothetical protein
MNKHNLYKIISSIAITFLKDINEFCKVTFLGKYKYFKTYFFDLQSINEFIQLLEDDTIYVVIPIISKSGKTDDPYLILSKQILVTSYSNPDIVRNYL